MENIIKKWWFWGIIILVIFVIVCICFSVDNSLLGDYKKQSISILTEYKSGKLTSKETEEKIKNLQKKVEKEYKENEDNKGMYFLKSKLSYIAFKLGWEGEQSNSEIDNYISEIKSFK